MSIRWSRLFAAIALSAVLIGAAVPVQAQELTKDKVLATIDQGKRFLLSKQNNDGSWNAGGFQYPVGVHSLVLMALLNTGMTIEDEPIQRALAHLRSVKDLNSLSNYEAAVTIMALSTANDAGRDLGRIAALASILEDNQVRIGGNTGGWTYDDPAQGANPTTDRSNSQFAVLGLREASLAGVPIDRRTWELARQHWLQSQNADGGWDYMATGGFGASGSTGSMTVAGVCSLIITEEMLKEDENLNPDGTPDCCGQPASNEALERGMDWLHRHFAIGHNPGHRTTFLLYYLYGLERAGRLSGRRFFGNRDWYREGANFLVGSQSQRFGSWTGIGPGETVPEIGTSLALLFLSKGLAPVLINKLEYGPRDPRNKQILGEEWNIHPDNVRHLTDHVATLKGWPKLLSWQTVDVAKAIDSGGVDALLQAPICFIGGSGRPEFSGEEVQVLRQYLDRGGFLFACASCERAEFDAGFRELIQQMFPGGEATLQPLPADHPVYRSEYLLDADGVELWGVDVSCRTSIIYAPDDLSCLWQYWARQDPPNRSAQLKAMITRAMRVGVNVVAYATGRELRTSIELPEGLDGNGVQDRIERGFLQIAQLRHTGGWNIAPEAVRNLLVALNRMVGTSASTIVKDLPATDPDLFKYPMLYMHGRNNFKLSEPERERLKLYLNRGGVLFADSCCGAPQFDRGFRDLMAEMFPDRPLTRIPPDHEMFTPAMLNDVRRVKRRSPEAANPNEPLRTEVIEGEPFLEGIEIDGRYAVIYSKYDISCALERQASIACSGYVEEDAFKLAVNVVLYALLQEVQTKEEVARP